MTLHSGWPSVSYANHTPKRLLPCCASVRPHPDSAGLYQMSVRSLPQTGDPLPNGWREMDFVCVTPATLYVKVAAEYEEKSMVALPTLVAVTRAGSNVADEYAGPVVAYMSPTKCVWLLVNVPPGITYHVGLPSWRYVNQTAKSC